jgi:hypothetical protein
MVMGGEGWGPPPKPSREAPLPAELAGSARVCLARAKFNLVQLVNNAG